MKKKSLIVSVYVEVLTHSYRSVEHSYFTKEDSFHAVMTHDTCLFSRQIYQFNLLKLRSWVSISRRINPFANIPSLQDVIQIGYGKLRPSNEIGISNNQNHHKYLRVVLTSWNNREFLLDQPTFFYNFRRIIV